MTDAPVAAIDLAEREAVCVGVLPGLHDTADDDVAEVVTGLKGEYVPVAETVESFEALIVGELDDLPEQAFLNVGNIDQVQAKAKALRES